MMFRKGVLVAGLASIAFGAGCGGVDEKVIVAKPDNDPLYEPRQLLQRYADGQPMGSEATSFPNMVERVKAVDPASAEVLGKGFEDLKNSPPSARRAKAKQLLAKIQPKAYGAGPADEAPAEGEAAPK
jgi:hypothetical protein